MSAIPLRTLIRPAVEHIAATYGAQGGPAPEALIAAIGLQESGWEARDQLEVQNGRLVPGVVGPATGFGQFEKNGGVVGVMTHPASRRAARELVDADPSVVPFDKDAIWRHFATVEGDELHVAFMRLLLLTDPQPLPPAEEASEEAAFSYYLRNWRPGAWFRAAPESAERVQLRAKWGRSWRAALAAVRAAPGAVIASPVPSPAPAAAPSIAVPPAVAAHVAALERELRTLKAAFRIS